MTIDAEGQLYVAMWGGSRIDVYRDENGRGIRVESIEVPTALQTSSAAFGGDDLKTLFITTAAMNLTPEQQQNIRIQDGSSPRSDPFPASRKLASMTGCLPPGSRE